ncbi:MAG TPA: RNA-guided endonuclease TnpB family protein [Streptosporangiaceae bacterium]|nr:RNA-guided endonuclease TnpB family protein [Streptosporangiaceae bacterium]
MLRNFRAVVINSAAWRPRSSGRKTPLPLSACHVYLFGSYRISLVFVRTAYKCRAYPDQAKVARAHRKVRAARTDFLHRTSTSLVRDHDVIVLEDLPVKNMVRNRKLAKAISDCGWGTFRVMIEYKAARYGRRVITVDRWYPSSKTCSACGFRLADLSLKTRTWQCPSCGTRHDRDVNAAKNILAAGLAVARGSPGDACGAEVRHSGSSRMCSAAKQEPRPARAGIPVLQGGE